MISITRACHVKLRSLTVGWRIQLDAIDDGEEKLYFVMETKGSTWWGDLRHFEGAKIKCGEKDFKEVSKDIKKPAQYIKVPQILLSDSGPWAEEFVWGSSGLFIQQHSVFNDFVNQCLLLHEGMIIGRRCTDTDVFTKNIEIQL